jgi:hypothetical protein
VPNRALDLKVSYSGLSVTYFLLLSIVTHLLLKTFEQQQEEKLKEYQTAAKRLDNALLVSMIITPKS